MSKEEGNPRGGAASNGQSKAGALYAPDGSANAGLGNASDVVPLVMVSDLPEEALPHTEKFPLWIRALIFLGGTALSWAIIYILINRA